MWPNATVPAIPSKRNRILSTLAAVYLAIAAASAVCIVVLSALFGRMFDIPAAEHQKATALLWILAVRFVLLALPLGLFRNALYGEQRIYLINFIQVVATAAYAIGSWLALQQGYGVLALAWVNLAAMLLEYLGYAWFAYRKMAGLAALAPPARQTTAQGGRPPSARRSFSSMSPR